jgi:integrase
MAEFETLFQEKLDRRVKLGELAESSRNLYLWAADRFFSRMAELKVRKMDAVTPTLAEEYLIFRKEATLAKGGSGRGLVTETTVLQAVFNLAVEEGLIKSSPLRNKYKPDSDPKGPDPFTPEEIAKLDAAATGPDRLPFLLLRWTGLRGSDAVTVRWSSINWTDRKLHVQTRKRKTWVVVPLYGELLETLEAVYLGRTGTVSGADDSPILFGLSRAKLYKLVADLGIRAGVKNCHPHKFRASLACTLLERGATLFDVAKLLGDSHAVVEKFYAATTDKQQERIRGIMEKSG